MNREPRTEGADRPSGFYRTLLEQSMDMVAVVDPDGRIRYLSPAARSLTGYDPAERVGGTIFDLLHPDDTPTAESGLRELMATPGAEAAHEFRLQRRDGEWRWFHLLARNLTDDATVAGILVHIRDITDLRSARDELERARAFLHEVIDNAPIVLWKVDAEGNFELSEGQGLAALGLEPGEVVGQNAFELYADSEEVKELVAAGLEGQETEKRISVADHVFEARVRPVREGRDVVGAVGVALDVTGWAAEAERSEFHSKLLDHVGQAVIATDAKGAVIYWNRTAEELYGWSREEAMGRSVVELTVPGSAHDTATEIMESLRAGEGWSGEYTVRRKDGSRFPAYVTNVPVREAGELVAIIGVSADLTERKTLEAELHQAQKMEAVGQLAGGIAHDFNNLLTTIGGYAALAADRSTDPQVSTDLREIIEATSRARGLADKLLAFSRRRTGRLVAMDLNATVQGLVSMLKRVVGEHIHLNVETTDRPWPIRADVNLTEQAILNLALNARDAMPGGGTLTLMTERVTLDADRAGALEVDLQPGDYMRLVVEDKGAGIDPEIQDRIFEPFFTTKEVGKGTGLGLSMVFGAVKQVGGSVTVESEPGRGSRFTLYFPRAQAETASTEHGTAAMPVTTSDEPSTVLVVEDEAAVLNLARRVLDREGFRVITASTGEAARRLIEEEGTPIDLVLTDVIMPEMSGPELMQRLRARTPAIRSVFMSGYTADELESRGLDREQENFLPKPFTPVELVEAVRGALRD